MPNELSEKVYPDGTVVKLRDDTAREQISAITNLIDVQEVSVAYPSSGTPIQKAQAIATAVYNAITIKRPFTIVNINSDGVYRAEMLISAVTASFSYSQAIFMGYYTDKIYRIEYSNGTVSIKQLAEV